MRRAIGGYPDNRRALGGYPDPIHLMVMQSEFIIGHHRSSALIRAPHL